MSSSKLRVATALGSSLHLRAPVAFTCRRKMSCSSGTLVPMLGAPSWQRRGISKVGMVKLNFARSWGCQGLKWRQVALWRSIGTDSGLAVGVRDSLAQEPEPAAALPELEPAAAQPELDQPANAEAGKVDDPLAFPDLSMWKHLTDMSPEAVAKRKERQEQREQEEREKRAKELHRRKMQRRAMQMKALQDRAPLPSFDFLTPPQNPGANPVSGAPGDADWPNSTGSFANTQPGAIGGVPNTYQGGLNSSGPYADTAAGGTPNVSAPIGDDASARQDSATSVTDSPVGGSSDASQVKTSTDTPAAKTIPPWEDESLSRYERAKAVLRQPLGPPFKPPPGYGVPGYHPRPNYGGTSAARAPAVSQPSGQDPAAGNGSGVRGLETPVGGSVSQPSGQYPSAGDASGVRGLESPVGGSVSQPSGQNPSAGDESGVKGLGSPVRGSVSQPGGQNPSAGDESGVKASESPVSGSVSQPSGQDPSAADASGVKSSESPAGGSSDASQATANPDTSAAKPEEKVKQPWEDESLSQYDRVRAILRQPLGPPFKPPPGYGIPNYHPRPNAPKTRKAPRPWWAAAEGEEDVKSDVPLGSDTIGAMTKSTPAVTPAGTSAGTPAGTPAGVAPGVSQPIGQSPSAGDGSGVRGADPRPNPAGPSGRQTGALPNANPAISNSAGPYGAQQQQQNQGPTGGLSSAYQSGPNPASPYGAAPVSSGGLPNANQARPTPGGGYGEQQQERPNSGLSNVYQTTPSPAGSYGQQYQSNPNPVGAPVGGLPNAYQAGPNPAAPYAGTQQARDERAWQSREGPAVGSPNVYQGTPNPPASGVYGTTQGAGLSGGLPNAYQPRPYDPYGGPSGAPSSNAYQPRPDSAGSYWGTGSNVYQPRPDSSGSYAGAASGGAPPSNVYQPGPNSAAPYGGAPSAGGPSPPGYNQPGVDAYGRRVGAPPPNPYQPYPNPYQPRPDPAGAYYGGGPSPNTYQPPPGTQSPYGAPTGGPPSNVYQPGPASAGPPYGSPSGQAGGYRADSPSPPTAGPYGAGSPAGGAYGSRPNYAGQYGGTGDSRSSPNMYQTSPPPPPPPGSYPSGPYGQTPNQQGPPSVDQSRPSQGYPNAYQQNAYQQPPTPPAPAGPYGEAQRPQQTWPPSGPAYTDDRRPPADPYAPRPASPTDGAA